MRDSLSDMPAPPERARERRILDALHRAAVFCDTRVGWNRIGIVLSITIIAIAATVLYRILRTIDAGEVLDAFATTDWRDFAFAALCVAGGVFHADILRPVRLAHDRPV